MLGCIGKGESSSLFNVLESVWTQRETVIGVLTQISRQQQQQQQQMVYSPGQQSARTLYAGT